MSNVSSDHGPKFTITLDSFFSNLPRGAVQPVQKIKAPEGRVWNSVSAWLPKKISRNSGSLSDNFSRTAYYVFYCSLCLTNGTVQGFQWISAPNFCKVPTVILTCWKIKYIKCCLTEIDFWNRMSYALAVPDIYIPAWPRHGVRLKRICPFL